MAGQLRGAALRISAPASAPELRTRRSEPGPGAAVYGAGQRKPPDRAGQRKPPGPVPLPDAQRQGPVTANVVPGV